MENNLTELLKVHNISKINTREELKKIFDWEILDADKQPKIITKVNTLLIFDYMDFNSTYLIDIVNSVITENKEFDRQTVDIFYIDDFYLRHEIFIPSVSMRNRDIKVTERELLKPGFMIVLPKIDSIDVILEKLLPLHEDNFKEIIEYIKING
jgi:hypothetical protein